MYLNLCICMCINGWCMMGKKIVFEDEWVRMERGTVSCDDTYLLLRMLLFTGNGFRMSYKYNAYIYLNWFICFVALYQNNGREKRQTNELFCLLIAIQINWIFTQYFCENGIVLAQIKAFFAYLSIPVPKFSYQLTQMKQSRAGVEMDERQRACLSSPHTHKHNRDQRYFVGYLWWFFVSYFSIGVLLFSQCTFTLLVDYSRRRRRRRLRWWRRKLYFIWLDSVRFCASHSLRFHTSCSTNYSLWPHHWENV